MARTTQPVASPEAINAFIADVLKAPQALAAIMKAVKEATAQEKEEDKTKAMDAAVISAFRRKGLDGVKPRIDTKTYNLWIAEGFKVKSGEKSVRVRNLRLFHRSQVEPILKQEQQKLLAEREARRTADNLPKPSPVVAEPPKTAKKAEVVPISEVAQVH